MRFRVPVIDALPEASVERQGELWRLRDTPGTLHVCLADGDGVYGWVALSGIDGSDYYTRVEVDNLLGDKADAVDVYTQTEINGLLDDKADDSHDHDGRYYTQAEVNGLIDALDTGPYISTVFSTLSSGSTSALPAGPLTISVGENEEHIIEIRASIPNTTMVGFQKPSGSSLHGYLLTREKGASSHSVHTNVNFIDAGNMIEVDDSVILTSVQVHAHLTLRTAGSGGQFGLIYAAVSGSGDDGRIEAGSSIVVHQSS